MPHSAVPCSSHQSALATSLRGRTVGLPLVLYLHGHGLQDMEQEAPVAACLWQCEGGVGSQPPRGMANWELGSTEEKCWEDTARAWGSVSAVCDCWLGYFYFARAKETKCRAMHLLRGTGTDREPACENRRPCVPCWPSPLVSQPFLQSWGQVLLHSFQSTGCTTIKTAKKNA